MGSRRAAGQQKNASRTKRPSSVTSSASARMEHENTIVPFTSDDACYFSLKRNVIKTNRLPSVTSKASCRMEHEMTIAAPVSGL